MSGIKNTVILFFIILCACTAGHAQKCNYRCIELFGTTFIKADSITLGHVSVEVKHNDTIVISEITSYTGKYNLPYFEARHNKYEFHFSKKGYHSKFLVLNIEGSDSTDFGKYPLPMELDITLFPKNDTTELLWGLLDFIPISTANWNDDINTVQWNFAYTQSILFQVYPVFDRIKKHLENTKSWEEIFQEQKN